MNNNNDDDSDQILNSIFDQYMNRTRETNRATNREMNRATNRATNMTAPMQNRRITILDNLIYEYNRNMRDYQTNMNNIIEIVGQIQPITSANNVNSAIRSNSANSANNATNRSVPIRQPTVTRQPVSSTDRDYLFSYFIYPPTVNTQISPESSNTSILTDDQINQATESILFHTSDPVNTSDSDEPDNENRCPITMDPFLEGDELLRIKECGHRFKKNALMNWFSRDSRCPICRYNLHDYILDISSNPILVLPSLSITSPVTSPVTSPSIVSPSIVSSLHSPLPSPSIVSPSTTSPSIVSPSTTSPSIVSPSIVSSLHSPLPSPSIISESLSRNPYANNIRSIINNEINHGLNTIHNPETRQQASESIREGIDFLENTAQNSQIIQNLTQLFAGLLRPNGSSDITYTFENEYYDSSMNRSFI